MYSRGGRYVAATLALAMTWTMVGCSDVVVPRNSTPGDIRRAMMTTIASTGLVAAYSFDESSGSTSPDLSGNNNTATLGSGVTRTTAGKYGGALVFNGNGLVSIANSASLDLSSGMTLEAWVNPSTITSAWRDVIYKGNDNYYLMASSTNASKPTGGFTPSGASAPTEAFGAGALRTSTWTHLAVTYDGSTESLYVNGVLVSSVSLPGTITTSTNPLTLGGDNIYGQFFTGLIDEVRVYSRALSASQIQSDMTTPVGSADTQPPTVAITSPTSASTYSTSASSITIGGTASDNVGVTHVLWADSAGGSGTATGTTSWSATVPLKAGTNVITATAYDAAGNTATMSLTVTYTATTSSTPPGLVAAYAFDETSGTTSADLSGNNNIATLGTGVTRTSAGKYGGALVFNGSGMVTIANSASIDLTSGMTLEAWVQPSTITSAWRDVIYKANDNYYLMASSTNSSKPAAGFSPSGATSPTEAFGTGAIAANTWTHLAVTYDGTVERFYVNGVQVSSVSHTGTVVTSTNPLTLGGDKIYGQFFTGLIDEVRVYNRALSASEIGTDMSTPLSGSGGGGVTAQAADTVPPTVAITTPTNTGTYTTTATSLAVGGTASDNVGVTQVTWTNSAGGSGSAGGTTSWSATIPLVAGTNTITVTAHDAAGNTRSATLAVTDNPSTTTPPPGSDEPVFNPTVNTVVYQDNMDQYTSVRNMGAANATGPQLAPIPSPYTTSQPVDTTLNQLVVGRGGTGKALRLLYTGANQGSANLITINTPATANLTTHYFQYYARVTVAGSLAGNTLAVKWFEAWHSSGVDRVQFNTHDHLPCSVTGHDTYWQVYDQGRQTTCQGNQPFGPYFPDIANGQWHRFTFEYRPNTSSGSEDGVAKMWVDGVKVVDIEKSMIGVTPPGGDKPWCNRDDVDALAVNDGISLIRFGSTQTTTTPAWTYDIDDLMWWR